MLVDTMRMNYGFLSCVFPRMNDKLLLFVSEVVNQITWYPKEAEDSRMEVTKVSDPCHRSTTAKAFVVYISRIASLLMLDRNMMQAP